MGGSRTASSARGADPAQVCEKKKERGFKAGNRGERGKVTFPVVE